MDLPWGDERTDQFVTNVGLVTSDGPFGPNIMACEWTHHISYNPGLIAVCIRPNDTTHDNIKASKEFGVSICSAEQAQMSSIAGGSAGREVDKINALKELGFKFYKGKKIKAIMVEGAVLNAECKLIKEISLGDHTMFVGEVIEAKVGAGKEALVYHKRGYWKLGEHIEKPQQKEMDRIKSVVEKHRKK